jgi:hypothetical protein
MVIVKGKSLYSCSICIVLFDCGQVENYSLRTLFTCSTMFLRLHSKLLRAAITRCCIVISNSLRAVFSLISFKQEISYSRSSNVRESRIFEYFSLSRSTVVLVVFIAGLILGVARGTSNKYFQ